jgi:multicomponent K+:H+ antiporter subunit E
MSPVLSLALIGMWLLLMNGVNLAQVAFGALLSVSLVLGIAQLRPVRPRLRRLYLAVPLAARVLVDIVRSNLHVAAIVLGLVRKRRIRSGFVDIPLQLSDPHGLAVLAVIVTATPGTAWAGISNGTLTLHVLDLEDEAALIHLIKRRYEQPLMRIFQ